MPRPRLRFWRKNKDGPDEHDNAGRPGTHTPHTCAQEPGMGDEGQHVVSEPLVSEGSGEGVDVTKHPMELASPSPNQSEQLQGGNTAAAPGTGTEAIWNEAYARLRDGEGDLVAAYEKTIWKLQEASSETSAKAPSIEPDAAGNDAEKAKMTRKTMEQAIDVGLRRTEKEARLKGKFGEFNRMLDSVKGIITAAAKASSEASLVWAGACMSMEILANPISETSAQRDGIKHILARMDWYVYLADGLQSGSHFTTMRPEMQKQLKEIVIDLYIKFLSFQMRSVRVYHQSRILNALGDFFKYSDWGSKLQDIKDSEAGLERDLQQYMGLQSDLHLQRIATSTESLVKELQEWHAQKDNDDCQQLVADTVPSTTKDGLLARKGGLYRTCCDWFFQGDAFMEWNATPGTTLLVTGGPGKGKTMLMSAVIEWSQGDRGVGYFFCDEKEPKLNNQIAIMKGLIYSLTAQIPMLIKHIKDNKDSLKVGGLDLDRALFNTLKSILKDPLMSNGVVLIDALDECKDGVQMILDLILETASFSSKPRWVLSSREHLTIIPKTLGNSESFLHQRLGSDATVSKAIEEFVHIRLDMLWADPTIWDSEDKPDLPQRRTIEMDLVTKASGTYLWVALVLAEINRELKTSDRLDAMEFISHKIKTVPDTLPGIYKAIIRKICEDKRNADLYKDILRIVFLAERPLKLRELQMLVQDPFIRKIKDVEKLQRAFIQGGSFLQVDGDSVVFIHQSAKDFIADHGADEEFSILNADIGLNHGDLSLRAMGLLSDRLCRNVYGVPHPGAKSRALFKRPDPDPLACLAYPCSHWAHHLIRSPRENTDSCEKLEQFLRSSFLYWMESLGWLGKINAGSSALLELVTWVSPEQSELQELVREARKFFQLFSVPTTQAPLQVYVSGLTFAPPNGLVPDGETRPDWIAGISGVDGKLGLNYSIIIQHPYPDHDIYPDVWWDDNQTVVCKSYRDCSTWNLATGALLRTVECLPNQQMALSPDGKKVALYGGKTRETLTIRLVDLVTGKSDELCSNALLKHPVIGYYRMASADSDSESITTSGERQDYLIHSSRFIVGGTPDSPCYEIWDLLSPSISKDGRAEPNFELETSYHDDRTFLSDTVVCMTSRDIAVFEDLDTRNRHTVEASDTIESVQGYIRNESRFLIVTMSSFEVWDLGDPPKCHFHVHRPDYRVKMYGRDDCAIAGDGSKLALFTYEGNIDIWDIPGQFRAMSFPLTGIPYHNYRHLCLSRDGRSLIANFIKDGHEKVALWSVEARAGPRILQGRVSDNCLSYDGLRLAFFMESNCSCLIGYLQTAFRGNTQEEEGITSVEQALFLPSGKLVTLESGSYQPRMQQQGLDKQETVAKDQPQRRLMSSAISPSGDRLALLYISGDLDLWSVSEEPFFILHKLECHDRIPSRIYVGSMRVIFSLDGDYIAAFTAKGFIVWSASSGNRLLSVETAPVSWKDKFTGFVTFLRFDSQTYLLHLGYGSSLILHNVNGSDPIKYQIPDERDTCTRGLSHILLEGVQYLVIFTRDAITLWKPSSNEKGDIAFSLLHHIPISVDPRQLSATTHPETWIYTKQGTLFLRKKTLDITDLSSSEDAISLHLGGFGFNEEMSWITYKQEAVIWLPPEYQPSSSSVDVWKSKVAIVTPSGQVATFEFDEDILDWDSGID